MGRHLKRLFLLAAFLLLWSCATVPAGPNGSHNLFMEASNHRKAGRYQEAIDTLLQIHEDRPSSDFYMNYLADTYWFSEDYLQAAYWYEKAYHTQKNHGVYAASEGLTRTAIDVARSYAKADDRGKALEFARKAVSHAREWGDDTLQEGNERKSKKEILQEAETLLSTIQASMEPLEPLDTPSPSFQRFINSLDMEFILIPAGTCRTGSGQTDDPGAGEIKIGNSFFLGKYEVTQEEWFRLMGTYPSVYKGRNRPVDSVSWNDAQAFIRKLNEKEDTDLYRLPTLDEWRYAARAGTETAYFFGGSPDGIREYAWMDENALCTQPVGIRRPNPWGLYDIYGNVCEWCSDTYQGDKAALGGTAWNDRALDCHSDKSWTNHQDDAFDTIGFRVVRDVKSQIAELKKRAEQGDAAAQFDLAHKYDSGDRVTKDYAQAAKWYRRAAEQGNIYAATNLGYLYENGQGVEKNLEAAAGWYLKAAEQGYRVAQFNIGLFHANGYGVPQSYADALTWYRKAADQGYADAQNNLGTLYEYGKGVAKDFKTAVKWYLKAAEQGNPHAQNNLGSAYEAGNGVWKSYPEALKWYRKAADQGHADAQNSVGRFYHMGYGIDQNHGMAYQYYQKAAEQGHSAAQFNLGILYEDGLGVAKNVNTAIQWYRKSAAQGNSHAIEALKRLGVAYTIDTCVPD